MDDCCPGLEECDVAVQGKAMFELDFEHFDKLMEFQMHGITVKATPLEVALEK